MRSIKEGIQARKRAHHQLELKNELYKGRKMEA
jgi:hypothetical protein